MPQKISFIRHLCIPASILPFHPVLCVNLRTKFVPQTNRKRAIYISKPTLDENLCALFCIRLQVVGGLVMLCYGGRCCSRCSASFILLSFLFGLGRSLQAAKQGNFSRPFCLLKSVCTNSSPKPKLV